MTVTTRIDTDPVAQFRAVTSPIPAVISGLGRLLRELHRRRDLTELTELDDHILRDIGLTRAEIREAVARSLDQDAVRTVRRLSAERLDRGD